MLQTNEENLKSLLVQGIKLRDEIRLFNQRTFSTFPEFNKFLKSINEKSNSLNMLFRTFIRDLPNNEENAILITILRSFKANLKNLEKVCVINNSTYSNKFFKKASPLTDPTQKEYIETCLDLFTGSLNLLESYLNGYLHYDTRPNSNYPPIA
ncbi:MAG: hypothetical protein E6K54_03160 [Gammaproteobacteria bacterium]|nr:MAG: hypothetical protein E6K54_03160 [Gammaproteobacteria bacterium]